MAAVFPPFNLTSIPLSTYSLYILLHTYTSQFDTEEYVCMLSLKRLEQLFPIKNLKTN